MQTIKAISGLEPRREGEYPECYVVGHRGSATPEVTRIEMRLENLGSYGITWFDVFAGETLIASMNAIGVVSVEYFPPGE